MVDKQKGPKAMAPLGKRLAGEQRGGLVVSATFRILHNRVGEGGVKSGIEVLRIQQLLFLNGYKVAMDGSWGNSTRDALLDFQQKRFDRPEQFFLCDTRRNSPGVCRPPHAFVNPQDDYLFDLAFKANVLIRLSAGGDVYRRSIAFEDVHEWCEQKKIGFRMNERAVWGLHDYPTWAIVTLMSDTYQKHAFDVDSPSALNCTLYANLMMSVWKQGNAHRRPFDASVKTGGGANHFAKERYQYPVVGEFENAGDIRELTKKHPSSLYCLEFGKDWVGHLALLHEHRVYECNVSPVLGVSSSTLEHWVASHPFGWVLGPSPD
jgi:hypothetical protein